MTPDEFTRLIKSSKPAAFAERVGSFTEKERRALSKTSADLLIECRKTERADHWGNPTADGGMARLAVLAVCPWSKALYQGWAPLHCTKIWTIDLAREKASRQKLKRW